MYDNRDHWRERVIAAVATLREETHVKCDNCGDEACTVPYTMCGRDFVEECGLTNIKELRCQGTYKPYQRDAFEQ